MFCRTVCHEIEIDDVTFKRQELEEEDPEMSNAMLFYQNRMELLELYYSTALFQQFWTEERRPQAKLFVIEKEDLDRVALAIKSQNLMERGQMQLKVKDWMNLLGTFPSVKLYLRVFDDRIFREDVHDLIVILCRKRGYKDIHYVQNYTYFVTEFPRESNKFRTMELESLDEVFARFDVDKSLVTLIPDMSYTEAITYSMIVKPGYQTIDVLSPQAERSCGFEQLISAHQAVFLIYQAIVPEVDWRIEVCQKHPNCMGEFKAGVIALMKVYEKMEEGTYCEKKELETSIAVLKKHCNYATRSSSPLTPIVELFHCDFNDQLALSHFINKYSSSVTFIPSPDYDKRLLVPVWKVRIVFLWKWIDMFLGSGHPSLRSVIQEQIKLKVPMPKYELPLFEVLFSASLELEDKFLQLSWKVATDFAVDRTFHPWNPKNKEKEIDGYLQKFQRTVPAEYKLAVYKDVYRPDLADCKKVVKSKKKKLLWNLRNKEKDPEVPRRRFEANRVMWEVMSRERPVPPIIEESMPKEDLISKMQQMECTLSEFHLKFSDMERRLAEFQEREQSTKELNCKLMARLREAEMKVKESEEKDEREQDMFVNEIHRIREVYESEIKTLKSKLAEKNGENLVMSESLKEKSSEFAELKAKFNKSNMEALKSEIARNTEIIESLEDENSKLKDEVQELKEELENLRSMPPRRSSESSESLEFLESSESPEDSAHRNLHLLRIRNAILQDRPAEQLAEHIRIINETPTHENTKLGAKLQQLRFRIKFQKYMDILNKSIENEDSFKNELPIFPAITDDFMVAYETLLKSKELEDTECMICLKDVTPENDSQKCWKCLRKFHSPCVLNWFSVKETCPVCKQNLMEKK